MFVVLLLFLVSYLCIVHCESNEHRVTYLPGYGNIEDVRAFY